MMCDIFIYSKQTIKITARFANKEEKSFCVTLVPGRITWYVLNPNWKKLRKEDGLALIARQKEPRAETRMTSITNSVESAKMVASCCVATLVHGLTTRSV